MLWVDDELTADDAALTLMQLRGWTVSTVTTGRAAITALGSDKLDAIVLDLRLPDVHGLKVLEALDTSGAGVPVLVLTGYAESESVEAALRLGAADYCEKPIGAEALCSRLDTLVASTSSQDRPTSSVLDAESTPLYEGLASCQDDRPAQILGCLVGVLAASVQPNADLLGFIGCAAAIRGCNENMRRREMSRAVLIRMAVKATSDLRRPDDPRIASLLRAEMTAVHGFTADRVAERAGLTRAYFCRMVREQTGLGFGALRRTVRLRAATRYLLFTEELISQVAYKSGFEHPETFTRSFREAFGCSPKEIRVIHHARRAGTGH